MSQLKVARRTYQRAQQSTLAFFAENVYKRTNGIEAYQDLQPLLPPLSAAITAFQTSVTAAHNRGRSEMVAKKLAQEVLVKQLNRIADALNYLAENDLQLIVDAGFSVQPEKTVRRSSKLETPVILRAASTGQKGEIQVVVDDQMPAGVVVTRAVEYSLDREHWQNGEYHTHRHFALQGLPRTEQLWLRLQSLGHANKRSDWSPPVMVAVL